MILCYFQALVIHGIVTTQSVKGKNNINHDIILLTKNSANPDVIRIFTLMKAQLKKENKIFDPLQVDVDADKENQSDNVSV